MIVKIATTEREFRNTHPGIVKMLAWIDEFVKEEQTEFSHLIVDGTNVVDAPFDHVKKRIKDIKGIEVCFLAKKSVRRRKKTAKTASDILAGVIQVRISNLEFTVKKTPAGVNEIFTRIEEAMEEFQVYFSHLIVDGKEVTDSNLRMYLEENLEDIKAAEVFFLTAEQFMRQIMQIMDDFIRNALPVLKVIADDFYGHPDDETWQHFQTNMHGIASMLQLINSVVAMKELSGNTDTFASMGESIAIHLENLQNAAKLEDYTMMADILHFELVPFMENLHTAVSEMVRRYENVTH